MCVKYWGSSVPVFHICVCVVLHGLMSVCGPVLGDAQHFIDLCSWFSKV